MLSSIYYILDVSDSNDRALKILLGAMIYKAWCNMLVLTQMDCVTLVYGNLVELLGVSIESLMEYLDDGKSTNWEL